MSVVADRSVDAGAPPVPRPIPVAALVAASERTRPGSVVRAYIALTKPRIVELLLVTTVPAMFLAQRRFSPFLLTVVVLVGGALAAGAANAINCYLDRDIDQVMRRTARRPLPAHTVSPRAALTFGLVLAAVSLALMGAFPNRLATGLTAAAIAYSGPVHTPWPNRP